jgi:uncharacterized phage protein (TIGR02220 family)
VSKYMSWYCFDAGMARDPDIMNLPDNDYRWAWVCLLGLEKQNELEGQDVQKFAKHCDIPKDKFVEILVHLQELGKLDDDFRPANFNDWQEKALKSARNKRYRDTEKTEVRRKEDGGSRSGAMVRPSESHTHSNTESKKEPQNAGKPAGVSFKKDAQEVLDHLNRVTGRGFTKSANIEACLKREKCSVDDCKRVIDFKWQEWKDNDKMRGKVDITTPWRASHFSDYLDQARAGGAVAAPPDLRPKDDWGKPIPEWELKMRKDMEANDG